MGVYRKNVGLLEATYKANVKVGSIIIESPGKFLVASYGLDAASLVNVRLGELPNAITDFIGGNASVTAMTIPPSVSDVKGVFAPVFPNLEKVYLGNAEGDTTLKDGLDTAYANLTVDVYCEDNLLSGYQTKYASATNLTFIGVSNLIAYEIPFVGETTLTAEYVAQVASDLGTLASAMEKIVVPSQFTDYAAGAIDEIFVQFPNTEQILFGTGQQTFADLNWAAIKAIAQMGKAQDYFALGDTKTDVGTDNVTRTFRIVDFDHYGENEINCEQQELEERHTAIYADEPTDDDGKIANYEISYLRNVALPNIYGRYSNGLKSAIGETTYKVVKNRLNQEILELTDKLLVGANKEYFGNGGFSVGGENYLQQFGYYVNNHSSADFIKQSNGSASAYWERSPSAAGEGYWTGIEPNGTASYYGKGWQLYCAPVFSIK